MRTTTAVINAFFGTLLLSTAQPSSSAEEAGDTSPTYGRYVQRREAATQLFVTGYSRFGDRLRAAAILEACDKAGIAKAVDPSGDEAGLFLAKEIATSGGKTATFLKGFTDEEAFILAADVSDQLISYKIGYMEAIKTFKRLIPAVCDVGVKLPDKILKERSGQ